MADITNLLNSIDPQDDASLDELLLTVYGDLRRLAKNKMSHESAAHTLSATALVHEAYLRLVKSTDQPWDHRGHFFAAAAEAMRRILIESARRKLRVRHGGLARRVDAPLEGVPASERPDELIALNDALDTLAKSNAQAAELVKLRFFAGLTVDQAAESLGISTRTAIRVWNYARAWLYTQIYGDSSLQ